MPMTVCGTHRTSAWYSQFTSVRVSVFSRVPQDLSCDFDTIVGAAKKEAKAQLGAEYDKYDQFITVLPKDISCGWVMGCHSRKLSA